VCYGCVDISERVSVLRSALSATAHIWPSLWLLDCCFLVVESKIIVNSCRNNNTNFCNADIFIIIIVIISRTFIMCILLSKKRT